MAYSPPQAWVGQIFEEKIILEGPKMLGWRGESQDLEKII